MAAPDGTLTDELRDAIRASKPAILATLRAAQLCRVYPASHPRFWRRPDGGTVCDTCHPCPDPQTPRVFNQAATAMATKVGRSATAAHP